MLYSYHVGVDLGQRQDYTAMSIVEDPVWLDDWLAKPHPMLYRVGLEELKDLSPGWVSPAKLSPSALQELRAINRHEGRPADPTLSVRHLERLPLSTPYPKVVERVRAMLSSPPLAGRSAALVVDATGVGAGVVDMFVHAGLSPVPVTIHGGDKVSYQAPGYRVPKRDLIGAAQVLLQSGRLKIVRALPEAETLRRELSNFRVKIDPRTAHDSYSHWREAEHDDLVLATALAAWFRGWWNAHLDTANSLDECCEDVMPTTL